MACWSTWCLVSVMTFHAAPLRSLVTVTNRFVTSLRRFVTVISVIAKLISCFVTSISFILLDYRAFPRFVLLQWCQSDAALCMGKLQGSTVEAVS